MTEDTLDNSSASPVMPSDSQMSEQTMNSDVFAKPVSTKLLNKPSKRKVSSSTDKDADHSELKKKKKKLDSQKTKKNKRDSEDATESVDSGCIADITGDVTDWPQVEAAVLEERNYVLSLLSWLPDFQWVVPKIKKPRPASEQSSKDDDDNDGGNQNPKKKRAAKNKKDGTKEKFNHYVNEADEIDHLRDRYTAMLTDLKKGRRNKKKEGKLQRKLKNLNRRNKKNSNRQRKLEQAEIFEEKHKALEKKKTKKAPAKTMKIFNEKGKLVFSKFDFSSDGSAGTSKKSKNLEMKVAQAIKEKEMRKQLEMEGNFKASADIKEVQAWSSALQRAEGVTVRDDLEKLQKSLKKKEHRKKQSKKRWEERTAAVEKKMQDRQSKRQENLKSRRDAKREKNLKKLKKKGHIVPGF